jgi:hypothetical protein
MLPAFQVGNALTSAEGPSSWMRRSRVAWTHVSWAGVPFDEGFGFRRDGEILVETGRRLADLGVAALDEEPIALTSRAAGEVEADDEASIREPVSAKRVAHRPEATKGSRCSGAISSQRAPHSPNDWQTAKRSWPADVSS